MALQKNLKALSPSTGTAGEPPVSDPIFAPMLAQAWADKYVETEDRPKAAATTFRHSDAGSCSRALFYKATGVEVSNPLTIADYYRFYLGTMVHDCFQEVAIAKYPGAEIEHVVVHEDTLSSGHGDVTVVLVTADTAKRVALELKTINGFGFKKAVGWTGVAGGPRSSAKIQGALNAKGVDADELVIVYLSMELMSPKPTLEPWQRFSAEWRYDRDAYMPWADSELDRWRDLALLIDAGILPDRNIPDQELPEGAIVTNPQKGIWQVIESGMVFDSGTTWHCNYCGYQQKCVEDMENGR